MTDIGVDYADVVYCSVDDVKGLFRKEGAFGADSNPSDNQVLEFIEDATDEIDTYTRHAWRENQVTKEYRGYSTQYRWDAGRPVMLPRLDVHSLDQAKGDKLEIWSGNEWDDWVADPVKTQGRDEDYWLDESMGQLWIYDRFVWRSRPHIRLTYRYGTTSSTSAETLEDGTAYEVADVPRDIRKACRKLVAIELISSDQYTQLVPGGEGSPSPESAMTKWEDDVYGNSIKKGLLARHKVDPMWVEPY